MKIYQAQEANTASEKLSEYLAACMALINDITLEDGAKPRLKEVYTLGDCIIVVDQENIVFSIQVQALPTDYQLEA